MAGAVYGYSYVGAVYDGHVCAAWYACLRGYCGYLAFG